MKKLTFCWMLADKTMIVLLCFFFYSAVKITRTGLLLWIVTGAFCLPNFPFDNMDVCFSSCILSLCVSLDTSTKSVSGQQQTASRVTSDISRLSTSAYGIHSLVLTVQKKMSTSIKAFISWHSWHVAFIDPCQLFPVSSSCTIYWMTFWSFSPWEQMLMLHTPYIIHPSVPCGPLTSSLHAFNICCMTAGTV